MPRPIDADEAIKVVHKVIYDYFDMAEDDDESPITYKDKQLLEINKKITQRIKALPTADVSERKVGKWIYIDKFETFGCSVCGGEMVRNIYDYCPWCGAKMEGEEDPPTADVFDILKDIFEEYVSNCSDDMDIFQKAEDFISAICTFASFHSPDMVLMWETWVERKYIRH